MSLVFGLFLFSTAIPVTLIPFIIKFCSKFKIVDFPDFRKQQELPKVRVGGLAIILGFLFPLLTAKLFFREFLPINSFVNYSILGSSAFFIVGFLDDIFIVKPLIRLIFQISFSIMLWSAGIRIDNISFSLFPSVIIPLQNIELISIIFNVLWIVAIVNAINWLDGLDSLAAGISSITFLAFICLFFQNEMLLYAFITLLIFGSCLGFLLYNLPPAKILMGDGGSYFLGFNLAVMAILVNTSSLEFRQLFYLDRALFMLFIPLVDMTTVIFYRLLKRRSPIFPDRSHIHHRLLDSGISYKKTLLIIFILTIIFILIGIKI